MPPRIVTGIIPTGLLNRAIVTSGLDFTDDHGKRQLQVIEQLAVGGRFGVAIGTAGAGKTALLQPLVAAWKEQGREVMGASLAWRQADDLTSAGIDQRNVQAFSVLMDGLKDGSIKVDRNTVIAVDELGLLGTRQGLELLRKRDQRGFSIVALGDDKQCSSIEAGAIIDLSRRALGAEQVPEILTTKRQQTEREREIVRLFRDGDAAQALAMKRSDGTAEMAYGGREGVIHRVVELYKERLQATGQAPTISAPTNTDAHQIGEAVRQARRDLGMVGQDLYRALATDGERNCILKLAQGDKVRLFEFIRAYMHDGKRRAIGRNGSVLEVIDVHRTKGIILKNRDGRVGLVHWQDLTRSDGRVKLAYGDAMTIHTAQGSTSPEHILALPSGSQTVTGNQAYVGGTRHRNVAYLITSETAERIAVREARPLNDKHEITMDDKWANVARNFIAQGKTDGALSMMEKVSGLRRGAVRSFHHAMRPSDPRMEPGPVRAPELSLVRQIGRGLDVAQQAMYRAMERAHEIGRGWSMGR